MKKTSWWISNFIYYVGKAKWKEWKWYNYESIYFGFLIYNHNYSCCLCVPVINHCPVHWFCLVVSFYCILVVIHSLYIQPGLHFPALFFPNGSTTYSIVGRNTLWTLKDFLYQTISNCSIIKISEGSALIFILLEIPHRLEIRVFHCI